MKKVLTIAGSDSSGGAGIQADLKTFYKFGVWGLTVITSLTAQNSKGVLKSIPVDSNFLYKQIEAVATDIKIDAVKIGMLLTEENVLAVAKAIEDFKLKNIVLDTVLSSKNGKKLLSDKGIQYMKEFLIPKVNLITPNIPEAEILINSKIKTVKDVKRAAIDLKNLGAKAILIKGGHLENSKFATDILYFENKFIEFKYPYIKGIHPKGTGCTLSSAIASSLAKGLDLKSSIEVAKTFLYGSIKTSLKIGKGYPVLNFWFPDMKD